MTQRQFNAAFQQKQEQQEYERKKRLMEYERKLKRLNSKRFETKGMTLEELFTLMEVKGQMGVFQSFNPRDFGADYDIVPVPRDNTPGAEFWFSNKE